MVPHRRSDRPRLGCRCDPGDREPFRCVLPRNQSHPGVSLGSLAARTHRGDPERDLLYRPQAFHNGSAPRCRHRPQSLPLSGFPPADLAEQVAANSQASSSREYCRLDLPRNLLVSSFSKLGLSHSPSHPNGPDAQQQRLHHHHPRRQRVELDLPRQLLDRHLYQRPRRLCSHRISGSDRPEWSALPRRTTPTMARPPLTEDADRKTRPLLDQRAGHAGNTGRRREGPLSASMVLSGLIAESATDSGRAGCREMANFAPVQSHLVKF